MATVFNGDDLGARHHHVVNPQVGKRDQIAHHRFGFEAQIILRVLRLVGFDDAFQVLAQALVAGTENLLRNFRRKPSLTGTGGGVVSLLMMRKDFQFPVLPVS